MREVPLKHSQDLGIAIPKKSKILFFAAIGNCLELYDYTLYAVMIPFLAPLFFPSGDASLSLIFGYISFAIAFVFAPIGSVFWGWYGDKYGRLNMLRFSMVLMTIPSIAIAILPTFNSIGWLAPFLLIVLRIMQGVSASGEVKGSKIFAMEHLGEKYYGITSGIISAAGALGVLFAMFMAYLNTQYQDIEYFWRIPFVVGSCLYFVGIGMRMMLSETSEFKLLKKDSKPVSELRNILSDNKRASIVVFMLGGLLGVLSYMMHAFMPPFLHSLGFDKAVSYQLSIIALLSTMGSAVVVGYCLNQHFNAWMAKIINVAAITTPLYFVLVSMNSMFLATVAFVGLGANLGAFACVCSVVMFRVFPVQIRCRGVLFNYALGVGLFGGFTPLILKLLSSVHYILPALLVSVFAIIVKIIFVKEVKHVDLS